ncbi:Agamous-like MADS-box protein [Sesamum alatum]|uniref:Agamous-like MADS-box protein n=1 Tax=Sesamum alatum TaxID=300844 RepID=A0AAE1YTC8_9LAMI|nr:Agamous-like MADS-box protein [Sesamum alatum]
MAARQTRGRQRIPMRLIESQDDLYATFSKRRLGLYKKASELSTLCGVDIGIIIFSPTDNPYSFFHPSMESVVERYRNPNQPQSDVARIVEAHTRTRIEQLNQRLDEVLDMKEQIKEREKYLDEVDKTRPKGWWEQIPVESLNAQQVQEWKAWFTDLHARVTSRIEELRNGGSGPLENAPIFPNPPNANTTIVPGMFPQNYVPPAGTSDAPGGGVAGADQFPDQFYYALSQGQDPFTAGPSQFYAPSQGQDPSGSGTSQYYSLSGAPDPSGVGPTQYYGPTTFQNLSGAEASQFYGPPQGQTGVGPSQYFGPPPAQDPSGSGPSQFYGLPLGQDPSGIGFSHFYVSSPSQDPSGVGPNQFHGPQPSQDQYGVGPSQDQSGVGPSQFYRPPLCLDQSGAVPRRVYNPQQGQDTSVAGGTGEAGTSSQGGQ